jgi:hypothetical protein
MKSIAFHIDCSELTMDEELALAISDSPKGQGIALVNAEKIVFDYFGDGQLDKREVESVVSEFVVYRNGHELYSVERVGDFLAVHSADPVAAPQKENHRKAPSQSLQVSVLFLRDAVRGTVLGPPEVTRVHLTNRQMRLKASLQAYTG